jgi:hypothetical protein
MGLGLTLTGLIMTGAVVSVGQFWLAQSALADALTSAVVATSQTGQPVSPQTLSRLVDSNAGISGVAIVSLSRTGQGVTVSAVAPVSLWFWAPWMGPTPFQVAAST